MGGHGPGGSRRARRALALAAIAAGVGAPGALAAPVDLGPGRDPFAVVAPDGTAYVAFNGTETTAALRFCRLPRGAGACAAGGAIPTPGTSLTRPFVVVDGATVKVLSYRYGEGVPGFSAVYLFTSTDGGASFGPGRQVGTQNIHTAVAGPGTGVSIASSAEGGGGKFQRVPTDPDSPKVEQVATLAPAHAYLGAVGLLDAGTPVVVFSDASGNAITRRFTGSGSINDAASWTAAQPIGHATASHLAGGPRGLFLLNAAADGRLELRRHDGTAFAPPVPVPDGTGDTVHAHLTQDAGGRLHAVWPRLDGSLHYAASDDGTGFTRGVVVRDADGVTDLRAAAAADHEGVAIWQTRGASRVRLAPIPPPPGPPPDAEPPDTLITAGPGPGSTVTSAATFEFSSTEDGSRFECSVKPAQLDDQGGPSWGPCASPYRTPGFGFAYLRFRVRAIDGAGNADPSPATVEYFSDPVPYGNVRVRGIDLFQLVQPNSGAQMFGYAASGATAPFPRFCGGGTPTGGTIATSGPGAGRFCQLLGNPRRVTYQGVPLDTSKPATAIVYVGMEGAATSDAKQPLDVTLVATAPNGRQIGPALVERITNPPVSGTSWVTGNERRNALAQRHGVRFAIPSAWLGSIAVNLRATVSFAAGTRSWNEAECYNNACAADNAFELVAVRKAALPPVLITPLLLRSQANQVVPGGFPAPESVFDVVRHVVPGGDRIRLRWYGATLDITTESGLTVQAVPPLPIIGAGFFLCSNGAVYGPPTQTTAAGATRQCRIDAVSAVVDQWVADNPPRHVGGDGRTVQAYDIAAGIHSYAGEPGWQWGGNLRNVDRTTVAPVPRLTLTCCTRPLTAATHELLHAYTAPHAGQSCPGTAAGAAQAGEAWAGDNNGRLQGTRFDRRQTGAPHIGFDDAVTPQLYDVMSYCAANNDTGEANSDGARGDAWISPRNWNRAVGELQALAGRVGLSRAAGAPTLGKRRLPRAAQAQTRPRTPFAVGQAGSADGRILRVLAPDGSDAIPASDPASPLRLRSLAADGRVLQDAGVVVNVSSESPPGSPGTFVAPVAAGAAAVELVRDGRTFDRVDRDGVPRVQVTGPRAGIRVTERGRLDVRWAASDPERDVLQATVDYSSDDGRTWQTIATGPSTGRVTVRGDSLFGSRRARVRVTVNDGFSEATVRSGSFRVDGRRPDVRITSPARGTLLQAGIPVRLAAVVLDARGAPLDGRAVRWFAGRRPLGSGAQLTTRLPSGRVTLRAVARDGVGETRTVTKRVTVAPNRLRLLRLEAPRTVARGARSVTVTVASSWPARLRAAGRSHRISSRARRITLRLPRRPATGPVRVPFVATPRPGATGRVSGRIEVHRGPAPARP